MGFNRAQQGEFRPLEKAAWQLHCSRCGLSASDKAAYKDWYRTELEKATGRRSTSDCNGGRHFEKACAHFEALADYGIEYQLRLIRGDLRRIRYAANQVNGAWARQFQTDAELESYVRGIVARAFGQPTDLHLLTDDQVSTVTQIVRVDANRLPRA